MFPYQNHPNLQLAVIQYFNILDKVMSFTQKLHYNFVSTSWLVVNFPGPPFGAGGWPQCTLVGGIWPEEPQMSMIFHHLCPASMSPQAPTLATAS